MWLAVVAIFLVAAAVRFSFWSELRGTALDRWQRFDQSDMATYLEQAKRIAKGDLLQAEPYHPYHSWQLVAPPEKWLAWYGRHSFHQAPAYSYLLAWVDPFAGEDFALVKGLQLLMGAGTCVLLFLITRHLWGFQAGCAAGALACVYGPLLFLEAQLLREGPALFCILAIVFALMRQLEREGDVGRAPVVSSAGLGLAAGAFSMFHEMGSVLTLVLMLSLAAGHARASARMAAIAVASAAIGWLVGFSPLLARNLAVGAPPLSVSCRTVINFVESNVADAPDGGATFGAPSASAITVLDASHDSALAALSGVWRTYDGNLGAALANLWTKFSANWIGWEIPDNTSFEFFRQHASTLRFAPTFEVLFPLSFAGLALVLWTAARGRRQEPVPTKKELKRQRKHAAIEERPAQQAPDGDSMRHPAGHLVLALLFLALVASLSLVHTVARFRMYLVPICIVYAGILLAILWRSLRERRLGSALALALIAGAGVYVQHRIPGDAFVRGLRPMDYAVACKLSIENNEIDAARRFAAQARQEFPTDGFVHEMAGSELERAGRRDLALEFYRQALELDPMSQRARDGVRRLQPN